MESSEIEKSKVYNISGLIGYLPHLVASTTIITRTTGSVRLLSLDTGVNLPVTISPFDTFVQVIEGKANIEIDGSLIIVETGQSIIIPAHQRRYFEAKERFKMLQTIIKSGYEFPIEI